MRISQKVIQGDCIPVMAAMAANSYAACISDPPYNYEFVGREWDREEIERRLRRVRTGSTMVKNIPYGSGLAGGLRNARWYERNRQNVLDYIDWCGKWSAELFRVCKAGAPVAIFSSSRTAAHVQVALEQSGFYARDVLVYRRSSGIPRGLNLRRKLEKAGHPDAKKWAGWHTCFRNEWEAIVLVQKPLLGNYWNTVQSTGVGVFRTINDDGSFQSNILEGYRTGRGERFGHCTVKPLSLTKQLIKMLVPKGGDHVILDPFAGSGTTLVAARDMGYRAVGIEIEPQYVATIERRLQDHGEGGWPSASEKVPEQASLG